MGINMQSIFCLDACTVGDTSQGISTKMSIIMSWFLNPTNRCTFYSKQLSYETLILLLLAHLLSMLVPTYIFCHHIYWSTN
jgi:putative flippase GtrA